MEWKERRVLIILEKKINNIIVWWKKNKIRACGSTSQLVFSKKEKKEREHMRGVCGLWQLSEWWAWETVCYRPSNIVMNADTWAFVSSVAPTNNMGPTLNKK